MKKLIIIVAFMIQACGQDNAPKQQAYNGTENALMRLKLGGGLTGQASQKDLDILGITQEQYQILLESGQDQIEFIQSAEEMRDCNFDGEIVYWNRTNYYYTCLENNWHIIEFNQDGTKINRIY